MKLQSFMHKLQSLRQYGNHSNTMYGLKVEICPCVAQNE